jgi:hypothetical protein
LTCLECGKVNRYGSQDCSGCGLELSTVPPYIHSNHVCQLTIATQEYLDQQISREEFLLIVTAFEKIANSFIENWQIIEESLGSRLAANLKETYSGPVAELDQGLKELLAGLEMLQQFRAGGSDELLKLVDEKLLDYFKLVCTGSAGILHEVELEELRQINLGRTHDYSA